MRVSILPEQPPRKAAIGRHDNCTSLQRGRGTDGEKMSAGHMTDESLVQRIREPIKTPKHPFAADGISSLLLHTILETMKTIYYCTLLFSIYCVLPKHNIQGFPVVPSSPGSPTALTRRTQVSTWPREELEQVNQKDSVVFPKSVLLLLSRRDSMLLSLIGACSITSFQPASAAGITIGATRSSSSVAPIDAFVAPVTHKLFMNVRISRSDGTFYVRDEQDNEDDKVLYARLVIGLFGTVAPINVQRFLSYIPGATAAISSSSSVSRKNSDNDDDMDDMLSLPSYSQSSFPSLDQATGLLTAGVIPALHVTEFNGATALQYGGRLLPAPLWLETSSTSKKSNNNPAGINPTVARVSHSAAKGLLTHRQLDVTPAFQMTTRVLDADTARTLDATNVVFGQVVLWDKSDPSALAFFRRLQDIPTYSGSRPSTTTTLDDGSSSTTVDAMAASIYRAQRDFFRGAAQTLGDQRINNIYEGKFLRRVEVTQIGMLDA